MTETEATAELFIWKKDSVSQQHNMKEVIMFLQTKVTMNIRKSKKLNKNQKITRKADLCLLFLLLIIFVITFFFMIVDFAKIKIFVFDFKSNKRVHIDIVNAFENVFVNSRNGFLKLVNQSFCF